MFANLFTKTLRDQRRALVGWGSGVALTVLAMAAIWPSFADMDINSLLDQYPDALKKAFNITEMSTGAGYMNAELFSFMLPIMFIVFAVGRGARLIAGEEEDGTLETLAALPLSRSRLLIEKAAALAVGVGALAVVLLVSLWLASVAFGMGIPMLDSVHAAVAMFLFGFEFGFLALAISAATGRRTLAAGVASGFAGGSYLLFLMSRLVEGWKPFGVVTPFHQALAAGPIGPRLPPVIAVMAAVGVVAVAASVPRFTRRDLAV